MTNSTYKKISRCRICGNKNLETVIHLGNQQLTGVFPRNTGDKISSGPLTLVKCLPSGNSDFCGLLQLRHSFSDNEMYCQTYGYRSGLNRSMVNHLEGIANEIIRKTNIHKSSVVLDIGSNDATLLKFFASKEASLIGFDPGGNKFLKYYPHNILLVPEFF